MKDFESYDALGLAELVRKGATSADELLDAALERVDSRNPALNAVNMVWADAARAAIRAGLPDGPFRGVPFLLKDLHAQAAGKPVTYGSRLFANFVSESDSELTLRYRRAGLLIFGRTTSPELGLTATTESTLWGVTRNPWNLGHTSGGSSGGASAAVAAGMAAASLGTDTGGSIRQPAAFCGAVGLKPTYGRVSRYGVIAFASSLDQVGPFGRTVEDVALMLQVIAGADPMDSTAVATPVPDYRAELGRGVEGLRIGIPAEYFIDGMSPEVESAVRAAIVTLERLGARTEPVSLPHTEYGLAAYYVIAPAEASSNLARYDGVKYGLRAPGGKDLIEMYA